MRDIRVREIIKVGPHHEISTFIRRDTEGHSEKVAVFKPRREFLPETDHAGTLILDFSLQNCEQYISVV